MTFVYNLLLFTEKATTRPINLLKIFPTLFSRIFLYLHTINFIYLLYKNPLRNLITTKY